MRKAIILDYICDQNAPSKPYTQIFVIPDDTEKRDKALRKLWCETFIGDKPDEDWVNDIPIEEEEDYGDLVVGARGEEVLFVTFLDEETPEVVLSGD